MLLTKSNAKIAKGEALGWKTHGVHLAPAKLSGKNTCPNASVGCAAACLNLSGQGFFPRVQKARIEKTKYFFTEKEKFLRELKKEIETAVKSAAKKGMRPCFRLNLTSDIAWESVKLDGKSLIDTFPTVQFYDYTKSLDRMMRFLTGSFPNNYHLTFSRSESNQDSCDIVAGVGGNVAVVFRGKLPKKFMNRKVVSGDDSDLRFLDKKGVIVGLVEKGKAKKDKSGFVVEP